MEQKLFVIIVHKQTFSSKISSKWLVRTVKQFLNEMQNNFHCHINGAKLTHGPGQGTGWLRYDKDGIHQGVCNSCPSENFEYQTGSGWVWVGETIEKSDNEKWQDVFHIIQVGPIKSTLQNQTKLVNAHIPCNGKVVNTKIRLKFMENV